MSGMRWAAAVAVGLGFCALAAASIAEPTIAEPNWRRKPTPEQLLSVWPPEALRRGLGGRAVIQNKVNQQGALFGCVVVEESPAGENFGAAAIALTPQFLMKPAMVDGKPVVGEVRIPINFRAPEAPTGTRLRGEGAMTPPTLKSSNLSNVTWRDAPSYDQVAAAYPAKARAATVGGHATLSCTFRDAGRIGGCDVLMEEPRGQGFAQAAKQLAPLFLGPAAMKDGRKTGGMKTQVPFTFAVEMLDPAQRLIGKPTWVGLPDGEVLQAAFDPPLAKAGKTAARVVLGCTVGPQGRLADCKAQTEEPAGAGLAEAAVGVSSAFTLATWTADGLPTIGGRVRVPLRYEREAP